MTVKWHGQKVKARIKRGAYLGVIEGTELVKEEMVRSIQSGPKTGRLYRRRSVTHRASAPGEAPASDTGRLVQSITTAYKTEPIQGRVNAGTDYAASLEYGTTRMEPRPYARPALASKYDEILKAIMENVKMQL